MRRPRILSLPLWLGIAALGGCGDAGQPTTPAAGQRSRPQQPKPLFHDFGIIAHGQSKQHDYVIDTSAYAEQFVPLRAHLDCSCGRTQLILRDAAGNERVPDGTPYGRNAQQAGETLIARVFLDTLTKDPVDLPPTTTRGYAMLQPVDDDTGLRRLYWPLEIRFGIDCPVVVTPFAAIDFGKVPQSSLPETSLQLRGDAQHPDVKFLAVHCTDPAIEGELLPREDHTQLLVRCRPGEIRSGRAALSVETDMASGYAVNLSVTWKVTADIEAYPLDKLSFRARLDRAQTGAEAQSQYLQVVNHDRNKSPEFTVRRIVDSAGRDVTSCFEVNLAAVPGKARHRRLSVRYLGGLEDSFRGSLVLAPVADGGPDLPISLIVFPITP